MDIDLYTLTSFFPCSFCSSSACPQADTAQFTIHSLTSVHAHLDRTGLESIMFSETSAVILSSCTHTISLKIEKDGKKNHRDIVKR